MMKFAAGTIGVLVLLAGCDFMGKRAEAEARAALMEMSARIDMLERQLEAQRTELTDQCEKKLQAVAVPACKSGTGDREGLAQLLGSPTAAGAGLGRADGPSGTLGPGTKATIACANDRCTLPRTMLEGWLADPSGLAKQARVVPNMKDGVVVGFKLFGIRAGTEVAAIGLQNGDLVTRLGGQGLGSMDAALTAFTAVKSEREWAIEGERKGAPFKVTIVVE
jgi:hypothetical protein